jgi:prepilin-type N-terminal cleavage/methylation domain-containing protein
MLSRRSERGDTLVEVLLSITILAIVTVAAFSVLQRGVGEAQNSLERSQVRASIAEQMELINYLRDQYARSLSSGATSGYPANLWNGTSGTSIRERAISNRAPGTTPSDVNKCDGSMANSFSISKVDPTDPDSAYQIVNFNPATDLAATTFARPGTGMWIEPVASPVTAAVPYIDFYIRACWEPAVGVTGQVISSVMRVYDK